MAVLSNVNKSTGGPEHDESRPSKRHSKSQAMVARRGTWRGKQGNGLVLSMFSSREPLDGNGYSQAANRHLRRRIVFCRRSLGSVTFGARLGTRGIGLVGTVYDRNEPMMENSSAPGAPGKDSASPELKSRRHCYASPVDPPSDRRLRSFTAKTMVILRLRAPTVSLSKKGRFFQLKHAKSK